MADIAPQGFWQKQWAEVRSNAKWDAIKKLGGVAVMFVSNIANPILTHEPLRFGVLLASCLIALVLPFLANFLVVWFPRAKVFVYIGAVVTLVALILFAYEKQSGQEIALQFRQVYSSLHQQLGPAEGQWYHTDASYGSTEHAYLIWLFNGQIDYIVRRNDGTWRSRPDQEDQASDPKLYSDDSLSKLFKQHGFKSEPPAGFHFPEGGAALKAMGNFAGWRREIGWTIRTCEYPGQTTVFQDFKNGRMIGVFPSLAEGQQYDRGQVFVLYNNGTWVQRDALKTDGTNTYDPAPCRSHPR